jgi:hypothetical protein
MAACAMDASHMMSWAAQPPMAEGAAQGEGPSSLDEQILL